MLAMQSVKHLTKLSGLLKISSESLRKQGGDSEVDFLGS